MSTEFRLLAAVCPDLAATGSPLLGALGLAFVLVVLGLILLFVARRSPRTALAVIVLLSLPIAMLATGSVAAQAQTSSDCGPTSTSSSPPANGAPQQPEVSGTAQVVVVQTSANDGLAPGVAPSTLTGLVTNSSTRTVYVTEVIVVITAVTKAPQAVAGLCDASDYLIVGAAMPVAAVLPSGAQVSFSGAAIGFFNKPVNQDACKGATVSLGYTSL